MLYKLYYIFISKSKIKKSDVCKTNEYFENNYLFSRDILTIGICFMK